MKTHVALFFSLLVSTAAFAGKYPIHPCAPGATHHEFDLNNSDDLFFAGRFLVRNGRELEGIECLNRGKSIAPAYLDIRLELMYAFTEIGDQRSGRLEAEAFPLTDITPYYAETYYVYLRKINRIPFVKAPMPGFEYVYVPMSANASRYRSLIGEKIVKEDQLRKAVETKFRGNFFEARAILDCLLPLNPASPTVYFYSGIVHYDLRNYKLAEIDFTKALMLTNHDLDAILSMMRDLNAEMNYDATYTMFKSERSYFKTYGCLQLAEAVDHALWTIDAHAADRLQDEIVAVIRDGNPATQLCVNLQKY